MSAQRVEPSEEPASPSHVSGSSHLSGSSYVSERKRNPFVRSKTGGRILSASMLPAFMALPPLDWGVLTTIGRRTGKRRPKCVRAVRSGDQVYIVSIRPFHAGTVTAAWVLNIRADPSVSLRLRHGRFTGVARELSDPAEVRRVKELYCETLRPFDFVSCALHRPGWPTRAKVKALHRSWFDKGIRLAVQLDT
jgi:deazaflavin-dependent oxidoreductase (nitroreductase family)